MDGVPSAAIEVLLQNLYTGYIEQLTGGQGAVKWIEYELGTLIPQLEKIETSSGLSQEIEDEDLAGNSNAKRTIQKHIIDLVGTVRDKIRRAEDLVGTYTKREIQRDAATFKAPIYAVRIWKTSRQLHLIKEEITDYRDKLYSSVTYFDQEKHFPVSASAEQTVPAYLRRCMHYLLLFPPTYKVPARRLIVLWVAEGLVHSKKHSDESAEQIAQGYLDELERRGLILTQEKPSGKRTYSIDAGIRREALMKEAEKAGFFQIKAKNAMRGAEKAGSSQNNKGIRRLVDCYDFTATPWPSFIQIHGENAMSFSTSNLKGYYKDVISFLSFNTREGSKPGEDIGDFLRKCISNGCFIWLRVLDLERVFRPKLPDTLGKLIAMKYLGLRWTYLERLPNSVDKLFNLQVLDVKHTYISVLPRSIWRMQYLRHLYLNEAYRTRFPQPPSQVTLTALQTLWGAFADKETVVEGGFDKLLNIRKLGLSCRSNTTLEEMSKKLDAINKWISNLEFLETLRLKSRDKENKAADLRLTSLAGNRKLSALYLLGKLESRIIFTLPASLTNITLSRSHLNFDPMRFLGKLPNLKILRLLGQSVEYDKLSCPVRGFQMLKLLWIWKLESLTDLEAKEGSLPCLEELEIRDCQKLTKLPQLKNLKVKFTNMQHEIVEEARAIYAQFETLTL